MLVNVTRTNQDGECVDAATFYDTVNPCDYCKPLLKQAQEQGKDIELIISFKYEEGQDGGTK